jgi:hypothetical protein
MRRTFSTAPSIATVALVAVLAAVMTTQRADAAEIEGVHFADEIQSGGVTMHVSCVGLLRYKVIFRGYVAALYLADGALGDDALGDVPKRLELSYFWSIRGSDIAKAGDQILARNVDAQTFAALRPQLDSINSWYRDVEPDDRYSLTYVPGIGTELALNGSPLGTIEGSDFAASYFRVWLGEDPIDKRLRDQLLGCRRANVGEKPA